MTEDTEKDAAKPQLDENGLIIREYDKMVLVVVPPEGYAEATLRYARSALLDRDVGTRSVSTTADEPIHGSEQDQFMPNGLIKDSRMKDFAGLLLCGGPGAHGLIEDAHVVRLAREAMGEKKPIGAWGQAVAILARAGILAKTKVTGDPSLRKTLEEAGAHYTGQQVEEDGMLVTGLDESAGMRFGRALAALVRGSG
jgi:protease I